MIDSNGKCITSGNILYTFLKFTIPNIFSIMALTSAGIIDGLFVGRYVGEEALASVNIVMPIYSLVFGIAIMLTIGGAVRTGKYLGENNVVEASKTFTKIFLVITIITILVSVISYLFTDKVVTILGADETLKPFSYDYLKVLCLFFFFQAMQFSISVFIRVDGRPFLASLGMIIGSVINAILDYIFIAILDFGVKGAAYATGVSAIIPFLILMTHFFSKQNKLQFTRVIDNWKEVLSSAYNGSSELLSEISAGIIIFMFNRIMIENLGPEGVAAFTAINYALWTGVMLSYSIGDSLVPLVSVNFGAKKYDRIKKFTALGLASSFAIGLIIFTTMAIIPEKMISIFIPDTTSRAFNIAVEFAYYVKWAFFFIGLNIVFSSYFTAIHRPLESVIIASMRGIIMPLILLFTLPIFFGNKGIYTSLPIAEIITLIIALVLWKYNNPTKRIERR